MSELSDLQARVEALEARLTDHIEVPSWWNRRTDDRLRHIEQFAFGEAKYPPLPAPEE
jgi:hypothetical protein